LILGKNSAKGLRGKRFFIALVVVSAAFSLIGIMLYQQYLTSEHFFSVIESEKFDNSTSTALVAAFEKIDKSNQTVFNYILPVIAAWLATVLTFYFTSRNLDKVQDANEKAQEIISKLATGKGGDITLEELLKLYPESKNVQKVEFKDKVNVVETKAKVFGNVVVVDQKKILGVLYLKDLKVTKDNQDKTLKEFLKDGDVKDHITGKNWDVKKSKGLEEENYAKLSYQDKISEARIKMEQVKPKEEKLGELDVLGLVFENENLEAAINYQTLARYF